MFMTNILTFETIKLSNLRFLTPILICESFIESFMTYYNTHTILLHTLLGSWLSSLYLTAPLEEQGFMLNKTAYGSLRGSS